MGENVVRLVSTGLDWRRIEGEVLALDSATQEYVLLNRSAALLWEMLVHGSTREDLVNRLAAEYRLDHRRACADVDVLLGQLGERGLVEGGAV